MYGPEYLDWVAREWGASKLDAFLASFEPEDRKWVLAVIRDRFEVRVEHVNPLNDLARLNTLQAQQMSQMRGPDPSHIGSTGNVLMGLLGR